MISSMINFRTEDKETTIKNFHHHDDSKNLYLNEKKSIIQSQGCNGQDFNLINLIDQDYDYIIHDNCRNINNLTSFTTMKEKDLLPIIQLNGVNQTELSSNCQYQKVRSKSDSVFNSNQLNLNVYIQIFFVYFEFFYLFYLKLKIIKNKHNDLSFSFNQQKQNERMSDKTEFGTISNNSNKSGVKEAQSVLNTAKINEEFVLYLKNDQSNKFKSIIHLLDNYFKKNDGQKSNK
jgi:hypothetical protein